MRNLISIIFLLFSLMVHGEASLDSLYLNAGKTYEEGKFEEALDIYKSIINEGFESPEIYYNMGNAAFRSNKLGYSVLYYEKALKLDPSNEEARKNLTYVSIYKEDQLESVPEFFLKTWILSLFHILNVGAWSILALVFFAFVLIGLIIYIFASNLSLKKSGFFTAVFSIFLFTLSFSGALNRNAELLHPENAVIISPSVLVKSSPSQTGTDLFVLHEGTLIKVDDNVGEWIEIKISDGRVGWIPSESHVII